MIEVREILFIGEKQYEEVIKYFVSEDVELQWIGYIDILDADKVVFHKNLTTRPYRDLIEKTEEEKLSLVINEFRNIIGDPIHQSIIDKINNYEHALNNGYIESYYFTDPIRDDLETVKNNLINGMNKICEQKIEAGFYSDATGTSHLYRFNKAEDQLNFNQQISMMILVPTISEVYWKTEDAGVVLHTRDQFFGVIGHAAIAKQGKINRYWALKDYILKSTTLEELREVSWDDFVIPQE